MCRKNIQHITKQNTNKNHTKDIKQAGFIDRNIFFSENQIRAVVEAKPVVLTHRSQTLDSHQI